MKSCIKVGRLFFVFTAIWLGWNPPGALAQLLQTDPWLVPFTASGKIYTSPAASPSELTIYFGDNSGTLYAVDPKFDQIVPGNVRPPIPTAKWTFPTGRAFQYSSPTVAPSGTIYAASSALFALSTSGNLQWKFQFPNGAGASSNSSPAIGIDGVIYVASEDDRLYAIRDKGATFETVWPAPFVTSLGNGFRNMIASSPSVATDGSIYFVTEQDVLYALRPNGTEKWRKILNSNGVNAPGELASSVAIGRDGTLYVGSKGSGLYALRDQGTNSVERWKFDPGSNIWFVSSPAVGINESIHVSSIDGQYFELSNGLTSASPLPGFPRNIGSVVRSSAAVDRNGVAYVGTIAGRLFGISPDSSDAPLINYPYTTSGPIMSSPTILSDGLKSIVVFGCEDGNLYAAYSSGPLASLNNAAWPMFRKDLSHSALGSTTAPVIVQQPSNQSVTSGKRVEFNVVASANPAPIYQWRKGGIPILASQNPTATSSTLVINSANPSDAGVGVDGYDCFISNSAGSVTSARVSLILSSPPEIVIDPLASLNGLLETFEDQVSEPIQFYVFDVETAFANLEFRVVSSNETVIPNSGLITDFGAINGSIRTVRITPATNQFGTVQLTAFVKDEDGVEASTSFNFKVLPKNDYPSFDPISDLEIPENSSRTITISNIISGPLNERDQFVLITATSDSLDKILNPVVSPSVMRTNVHEANLTLTTVPGANGFATVTVSMFDSTSTNIFVPGFSLTTNRSFRVSIGAFNDPPVILLSTNRYFGKEDTAITLAGIRVADPDAGTGNLTLSLQSTNGVLVFGQETGLTYLNGTANRQTNVVVSGTLSALNSALSTLNYIGARDSSAADRVVVTINDQGNTGTGGAKSESKIFDIVLDPVNDAPVIARVPAQTIAPRGRLNVRVQVTDVDTPASNLTLVASTTDSLIPPPLVFRDPGDPSFWIVQLDSSGDLGTTSVTLLASDGSASSAGSIVVTIQTTNTTPTFAGLPAVITIPEDTTTNVVFSVADLETPAAALSVLVSSSRPEIFPPASLVIGASSGATRTLSLTPATNSFGSAQLVFVVGDGAAFSTNRVDVTVLSVNDLPTATPIADMQVPLNATTNAVFKVNDVETAVGAIQVQVTSSNSSILTNNPLIGGTGSDRSIRIAPAGQPGTAVLTVVVTDGDAGQTSFTFRVTVADPVPVILQQPASTTVISGNSASFAVIATGEPPLRYQWRFEGVDLPGSTSAILNLPSVSPANSGAYSVVVSNAFGSKASNPATLAVLSPPSFGVQPTNQTVRAGGTASFVAFADGTRPLSYQWLKDGQPIAGATSNSFVIPSVQAADAGRYALLVTNLAGSLTSREAVLALNANTPPRITFKPNDTEVPEGVVVGPLPFNVFDLETQSQLVFSATSSNQGLFADADISFGGSGPFRNISLRPKVGVVGASTITLTVKDPDGATDSAAFQVTVRSSNTPPRIQDVPDQKTELSRVLPATPFIIQDDESSANDLVVTARSSNQKLLPDSGVVLGGQNGSRTVSLRPASGETGSATVTLTVSDGQLTASDTFVFTVVRPLLPPVLLGQLPATIVTNVGANLLLSLASSGTDPLFYQWRLNAVPISGATNSNLTLTNLQINQSGAYSLQVSNVVGVTNSPDLLLTVAAEKVPPSVTLLQPTNGSTFTAGERIIFSASANDVDGLVTKVGFYVGTNLVGEDLSSPYNTNTVISVPGTYTVRAVATDNEGFETATTPITIEVTKPLNNLPTISITDVPGDEGNSGFKNFVFRLALSSASAEVVSVRFNTFPDTASAGRDFIETNGIVEFAPGVRNATVTVQVIGDEVPDGDNETFFVNLSSPVNALLADSQGIGTIVDDENPVYISVTDASVTEGNTGTNSLVFTIQLSEPSTQDVSVEYATANGTALAGQDYVNRAGRVVFTNGVTSIDVRIPVIPDLVQEPNKTMLLKLSNPANAIFVSEVEEGVGSITDDDAPPTARVEDLTLNEGNAGVTEANVVVNLTSASSQLVSVDYTTVDGTASVSGGDYQESKGTLVFQPGVLSQTIRVPVTADTLHEPDESFTVRISSPTNTTIARAEAVVKVVNDDQPPTLSIVGRNVIEGNSGTVDLTFNVLLSTPSGQTVTVDYSSRNVTALAGVDYQRVTGTLVFQPGETAKTVVVPVIGDLVDEPRETFEVVLDNPLNATISEGTGTGGITDDDVGPAISISDVTVTEGSVGSTNAVFQVTLSAVSGQTVTVSYQTVEGTAQAGRDYIAANATLNFSPGQTNRTISIPVLGDILNEPNETFQVKLDSPVNATISRDLAVGTIVDDDSAPALRVEDLQVEEGNVGASSANVVVRLTSASSQTVSVQYQIEPVTATAGEDFTPSSGSLVFESGVASKTISVPIFGDTLDEPNETFRVRLSQAVNATIDRAEAVVTIVDDDLAPTLSVVGRNVIEGNTGTTNLVFTLTLSTPSGQPVSVDYATQDGTATAGADYVEAKGTVQFAPGETTKTVPVQVIGDLSDEPRETFLLRLSNPLNATVTEDTATGAILNDDVRPTLSITDASVLESVASGVATLQVSLSSASGQSVTVRYGTLDGTALQGSDYTAAEGVLTFSPGETSKQISIGILGDSLHEETESFTVLLASAINANIVRSQAVVTILDDDDVPSFPPAIAPVLDQSAQVGGSVTVQIVLSDPDTPLSGVTLKVSSENLSLITSSGLVLTGAGAERTLTLTPLPEQAGVAVIALVADDGKNQAKRSFRLTVANPNTPPTILTQPVSRTVLIGTPVNFSVSASGSPPLAFQWRLNGTNVAGATSASLQMETVQANQAGEYSVVVSNPAGSVTSSNATLVVGRLGAKLWDFNIGKPIRTSVAIGADGSLFVGADDGRLHSLTHGGVLRWSFATGGEIYSSPAVGADGSIYFGSFDHKIYALNPDGSKRWEYLTGAEIYSSPAIGADGTIYVGSYDSKMYAIRADGTLKWEFLTGNTITSSASIGADGTIYFGSQDHKFYALNPDGTKRWEFLTSGEVISSPAIAKDGTVYFGSLDRRLYALRPDGSLLWQFTTINSIRSSPTIGEDGTLYFGTDDGRLYAVGADGRKKWDLLTGVFIFSSPAVGVDGTVYVGSFDRKLYAINPNGSKRWEFSTEGEVYSSPSLDRDGVVYLGSLDGRVYTINGTTGLAETPWPMFRRSLDHAGRAPSATGAVSPLINRVELFATGVRLNWSAEAGRGYVVQASQDLAVWEDLALVTAAGPTVEYEDRGAFKAQRFYRILAK